MAHVAKHGYPPSLLELSDKFRVTRKAVFDRVNGLRRKGLVARMYGSRALVITPRGTAALLPARLRIDGIEVVKVECLV